ncbi:MAG: AMP-binding protein [Proteobacteria bacterium]|nr:AMP-binding protein [Pseudomonadota bacterium]
MGHQNISWFTKIPDYINAKEMRTGILTFDDTKCKRCNICTFICPARSIIRDTSDKKSLPSLSFTAPGVADCIACGCCLAACPEGAISISRSFNPGYYFKRLTQTSTLSYPKAYQHPDENAYGKENTPSAMNSSSLGFKEKMRQKMQSLSILKDSLLGLNRFVLNEMAHGRFKELLKWRIKGDANDISWAQLLEEKAKEVPDKTYLLYRDESFTYRDMDNNANKIANYLLKFGGGKGKGLGIFMRNSPRFLDVFFGAQKIGMYLVPINPELKGEGLSYLINHSDIEGIVLDAELVSSIETVRDQLEHVNYFIVDDIEEEAKPFEIPDTMERLSNAYGMSMTNPKVGYNKEDICLIIYTSGTTGRPKGVVYRYKTSSVKLLSLVAQILVKPDDIYYTYLALCHGNALFITTTQSMARNATMALSRKFSASRFWEDIRKYDVTLFNTIGSIIPILMKQPEKPDDRDNKVRVVVSAACPAEMWVPFEKRFSVKLYEGYGAVDGGGKGVMNLGTAPPGSLGRIPPFVTYKLVDENDNEVPPGIPGELIFEDKKNKSRVEYYKNSEASDKKSKDGWIRTGDLIREDSEGYLYFVGRNTESMRKGGENVSAYEVELVIMEHPSVEEVAVYAVPSDMAEDEIMASVTLVDGGKLDPKELVSFLEDKLAKYAIPRYIRIVDDFQKTNTHRVIKRILEKEGVTKDTFDARA